MTYLDAIKAGFRPGDIMYARGYVSRRVDPLAQPVHIAGGRRRGQFYIELPNRRSTRYKFRLYLVRPEESGGRL